MLKNVKMMAQMITCTNDKGCNVKNVHLIKDTMIKCAMIKGAMIKCANDKTQ